jgi:hypothetical protein
MGFGLLKRKHKKKKMGLRLVSLVSTCFIERLGAPHQNLGFHSNQIPNDWLESDIQVICNSLGI